MTVALYGGASCLGAQTIVTDLAGRQVPIPPNVERILLGEGRLLPALAILEGDPTRRLVAMMGDLERIDPASYAQWRRRFPRLDHVARVGRTDAKSFSDERALALRPQVAILSLGGGFTPGERDKETLQRLEASGIAVVFVDFRHDPLSHTPRSMTLLGQVLGKSREADAFNTYWRQQLDLVRHRLQSRRAPNPTVFLDSRVGFSTTCCETLTGMLGKLFDAAGGTNIADGLVPGEHGMLNPELLIVRQPAVYIGTGIGSMQTLKSDPTRIALGAGVTPEAARESLRHALTRAPLPMLDAVKQGRSHAIWHHFYNSPFNVVATQVMAKWLHPELFADIDPRQTLQEMYRRFQPIALDGTYWIDAKR
ncbi:MAG: ABC transporter substrate-binding protein [Pseudomonadota bacterium]|nr:ABC transporter substrate-binding protein [Pseudomonadota bacterium]